MQWSPIIAASAFFPLLLPVTMAKPQVGLPVFLTRLSRRGVVACAVVGIVSLAVMPKWPSYGFGRSETISTSSPSWFFRARFLLLALLRYRDRDAHLLFFRAHAAALVL